MTIESRLRSVERVLGEEATTRRVHSHAQLVRMAHGQEPGFPEATIGIHEKSHAELVAEAVNRSTGKQPVAELEPSRPDLNVV